MQGTKDEEAYYSSPFQKPSKSFPEGTWDDLSDVMKNAIGFEVLPDIKSASDLIKEKQSGFFHQLNGCSDRLCEWLTERRESQVGSGLPLLSFIDEGLLDRYRLLPIPCFDLGLGA